MFGAVANASGGGVANHFGGGCTPPRKSMPGGEGGFAMTISVL